MKPLPFAVLAMLFVAWGLFTAHQRVLATRHGYMVEHLQEERRILLDENQKLDCEIAVLIRPERIAGEVRRLGLDLVDPVARMRQDSAHRPVDRAPQTGVSPQQNHAAD